MLIKQEEAEDQTTKNNITKKNRGKGVKGVKGGPETMS